jgi:hypothetical protein
MADKLISCCGLNCAECGAYIATQKNDNNLRRLQAEKWTIEYKHPMKPEDINCDGCTSTGKHVGYCNICEIRKCVRSRGLINCAWCINYSCNKLEKITSNVPAAKKNLEDIKKGMR